jgi:hypothetical protein
MNLWADFLGNANGRLIHKWKHYFPAYERHFAPFVGRSVTVIEIGVAEGGSLQMWKRFFGPHAQIIGIDVAERCKALEEDQVAVRIGSQDDPDFLESIVAEFGPPDIVIDDGSHVMQHMAASFGVLYRHLSKNGVYLVEDLHTAYHSQYGGGLRKADSFIESAKALVDELNADLSGDEVAPTEFTRTTHAISFYAGIVVFERGTYTKKLPLQIGLEAGDEPSHASERTYNAASGELRREIGQQGRQIAHLQTELERARINMGHALGALREAECERERLNTEIRTASDTAEFERERLNTEIRTATDKAAESRVMIERLRHEVTKESADREVLASMLATLRTELDSSVQHSGWALRRADDVARELLDTQHRLAGAQLALSELLRSKSWRLSEPFRRAGIGARVLMSRLRQRPFRLARSIAVNGTAAERNGVTTSVDHSRKNNQPAVR